MPSNVQHLIKRLSLMPGAGTPAGWLESAGPVVEPILRDAGTLAGVLVDRAMVEMQYRPTPFALKALLKQMEEEEGDRVADRRRARSRRCICGGLGMRTIWMETWSGRPGYLTRGCQTVTACCSCPEGANKANADIAGRWLTVPQWEEKMRRKLVPTDGSRAGVAKYWVDDGVSAPPDWTRYQMK